MKSLSHVQLFATPWTVACQASPSMGFSRQKYGSGLPFPSPWWFSRKFAYNVGDVGSVFELGRSPKEGNGNPLQYSCLENPLDGGAWRATVHGVAESQTQLKGPDF